VEIHPAGKRGRPDRIGMGRRHALGGIQIGHCGLKLELTNLLINHFSVIGS
jgi:hypothetical protein